MKLNNKGFAITSVLYGLLILFVMVTGSYLSILAAKKNRLDVITKDIEAKYAFDCEGTYTFVNDEVPYTGKYVFGNNDIKYLYKDQKCESCSGSATVYYHCDEGGSNE